MLSFRVTATVQKPGLSTSSETLRGSAPSRADAASAACRMIGVLLDSEGGDRRRLRVRRERGSVEGLAPLRDASGWIEVEVALDVQDDGSFSNLLVALLGD